MEKKNIVQEWIDALRSGKYKQGSHALRIPSKVKGEPDSYCCLGVLCDIVDPEGWGKPTTIRVEDDSMECIPHLNETGIPTLTVWIKVIKDLTTTKKNSTDFAQLNDREGWNFEKIADYLEGKEVK